MKLSEIIKKKTNSPKSRQQQIHEKRIMICQAMEKNRKLQKEYDSTINIVEREFSDQFFHATNGRNDIRRKKILRVLDDERLKLNPIFSLKSSGQTHIESMQLIPKE